MTISVSVCKSDWGGYSPAGFFTECENALEGVIRTCIEEYQMFISPAYAQGAGGGGSGLEAMLPLVLIFIVFYFLLIRPQQKKMKDHKAMLGNIRRGDTVITGGGITGKVTKVDDEHVVTVEIAKDVKVKVQRGLISSVQVKGDPVKGGATANENNNQAASGGGLGKLFGLGGGKQNKNAGQSGSEAQNASKNSEPKEDREIDGEIAASDDKDGKQK